MNKRNSLSYIIIIYFLLVGSFVGSYAQENRKMGDQIDTHQDSSLQHKKLTDSMLIENLQVQIQELKLNEILYQNEIGIKGRQDSIKRANQKRQIDSLRAITTGVPLIVEGDTLFRFYARRGGVLPIDRVEKAQTLIVSLGKRLSLTTDSVYVYESEFTSDIMSGDKVIMSLTDHDALWQNADRHELAVEYANIIDKEISKLHEKYGLREKVKNVLLFILVIAVQIALIYFTTRLFKRFKVYLRKTAQTKLKPISIKTYEFLDTEKLGYILVFIATILKYVVLLVQLAITIPILFAIFPETKEYASLFFSYVWDPAKDILKSIGSFIPSLFKIIVIYLCFKYLIRGLKYIANEIATGKLTINGFYADWAFPTYYILRFLMYSFMVIMIWPLLPNSSSPIFQGVSVFIGLIISLGSTSVIGNLMAGLVITYMRPFRIGDQIKLNDTTGTVLEKTPFVTRIRTPKNEIITIPNSFMLSSQTTNYTTSAQKFGIIVHSNITVGYEIPTKQVQDVLLEAAAMTSTLLKEPSPFVLILELDDFYCRYQINGYTEEDKTLPRVYTELHQNIIDKFHEAGIEILSPHFYAQRDGNDVMMPSEYKGNIKPK